MSGPLTLRADDGRAPLTLRADDGRAPLTLRADDGRALPVDPDRWHGRAGSDEQAVLDEARPPVLDVGCGPGRHVLALAERGVAVLGVDASPAAVRLARKRGVPVLERSIFGRIPGARRWGTALLLDGNIGIGGDPLALLLRLRALLRDDGRVLAEVGPPGTATRRLRVRLERGRESGPWFPWAEVGTDGLSQVAGAAGFGVTALGERAGRWFATLDRR